MLKLKLLISTVFLLGISCKSTSKLGNSNQGETIFKEEGEIRTLYKAKDSKFIENCVNADSELYKYRYSSNLDSLRIKNRINRRKVIDRPTFPSHIVNELVSSESTLLFCVNRDGETKFARHIHSSKPVSKKIKKEFLSLAMEYKYEKSEEAPCLECGYLIYKVEGK